jgi:hypothetical protein
MSAIEFCKVVLTLAVEFNFSVTSWIRSKHRNRLVHGVDNSLHLCGCAVDVVLDLESEKSAFIDRCRRLGIKVIDEVSHLHLQVE